MAFILNYNKNIHDLYLYNTAGPTINPQNYADNAQNFPISYNTNLYIKDPSYGFTFNIDFSGMRLKGRGAPSYGFDQFLDSGGLSSGIKVVNGITVYPNIFDQFMGHPGFQPQADVNLNCYSIGCPPNNFTKASDYNYWNNGQWNAILISPQHCLVTAHYIGGAGGRVTLSFLGKNNQIYTKDGTAIIDFRKSVGSLNGPPAGYTWGSSVDYVLCEFDTAFTESEQAQVKVYKFLNQYLIPNSAPRFRVNSQGVVYVLKGSVASQQHYFNRTSTPNAAYVGYVDKATQNEVLGALEVWVGDSGTPEFCFVPHLNETCFVESYLGGGGIIDPLGNPNIGSGTRVWFDALKSYIYNETGHEISLVNYFANASPETIRDNAGNTFFLLENIVSSNSINTGGLTYFSIPYEEGPGGLVSRFSSGNCYAFFIVAYNQNGYTFSPNFTPITRQIAAGFSPIVIMLGDENAIGLGKNIDADEQELNQRLLKIFNNYTNQIEPLNISQFGNNILGDTGPNAVLDCTNPFWFSPGQSGPPHGMELELANFTVTVLGDRGIRLLKVGDGGSTTGTWMTSDSPNIETMAQRYDVINSELINAGITPQQYLWLSIGKNDLLNGISAAEFEDNLGFVITEITEKISRLIGDPLGQEFIPILIPLIPPIAGATAYNDAIKNICNISQTAPTPKPLYWVRTDDAETYPDNSTVFTYNGLKTIANRMSNFSFITYGRGSTYADYKKLTRAIPPQPTWT